MWKRAVWLEGKKEEEGVVPSSWVLEGNQTLLWPHGVNAESALHNNQQEPDVKSWRKFLLKKVKITSEKGHMMPVSQKTLVTASPEKVASAPSQVLFPKPPPKVSSNLLSIRTPGPTESGAAKRYRSSDYNRYDILALVLFVLFINLAYKFLGNPPPHDIKMSSG
ncbi:hypothetical protein GWK47_024538 [Chionoecetes opilio]|uniref:Uncharacterized protein n=1 Tax=Chionoecetes opilio TaxID=41210 RepID=A0A8J4XM65_CHIOP|nr:hypothetical protein GWK47_024538 [Chionoecetes opilio]